MKDRIYGILVNRVPGIRDRYCRMRREKGGSRWTALLYAIWLNLQYYVFFRRGLARPERGPVYEQKKLPQAPESSFSYREGPEAFTARLARYDAVSFDVFDTLLFRCCSHPTDVFFFVGMTLQYPNFKEIRMWAEAQAREKKRRACGSGEVTLDEIWEEMQLETGIPKEAGIKAEWAWEQKCCYANPYMQQVVRILQQEGKRLFAVSDMYLGRERVSALLQKCGYGAFEEIFVSCDQNASKGDGSIYPAVQARVAGLSYAHVGDHADADYQQARRRHIAAFLYPNINAAGAPYRPQDLSAITGSVYRGLVNARFHSGLHAFSREYEYGFAYGGLFVAGYCRFIHACQKRFAFDKLLFLSRDGHLLLQAYRRMFPHEAGNTVYAYWSRLAATKLSARYYKQEYLQRFLEQKAGQHWTLAQIVRSMELPDMLAPLCRKLGAGPDTELTYKNLRDVEDYFRDAYEQVLAHYEEQHKAGKAYYQTLLRGCKSAAAIDIGWAGSGALMLDYAVNRAWGLDCSMTGILAGTNTLHNAQVDAVEPLFLSGKLISFLYSQQENRDLWKFHDPGQNHNLYWELLLGAPEGSLQGFYFGPGGEVECRLKSGLVNAGPIGEIHQGILDFIECLLTTEERLGLEIPISGRDAYAPMLLAQNPKNKKFMRALEGLLDEVHIG